MRRFFVLPLAIVLLAGLVALGCSQPAAAPTPAKAPAPAPTTAAAPATAKPVAPTAAPAAEPTKAPEAAPKVAYPAKDKPITFIVPWGAGGITDIVCRALAGLMEKNLGTSFVIVNKAGASGQVGLADLIRTKPDGYTIGATYHPQTQITYLDEEAKAPYYGRKDFTLIALVQAGSLPWVVRSDGPFKTMKDLVDTAKAKPEEIKLGTTGLMGPSTGLAKLLADEYGARLGLVHFQDGVTAVNALLGAHVDVVHVNMANALPHIKSGTFRPLGVTGKEENRFLPGVPTFVSQGYNLVSYASFGISGPAGTSKEVVDVLASAIKQAMQDKEAMKKLEDAGADMVYMGPEEYAKFWDEGEAEARRIVSVVRGKIRER